MNSKDAQFWDKSEGLLQIQIILSNVWVKWDSGILAWERKMELWDATIPFALRRVQQLSSVNIMHLTTGCACESIIFMGPQNS